MVQRMNRCCQSLQSQVRIDHVQKIIVKQSKGIEGTYYYIAKALEDPKWRAKMLVPIGSDNGYFRTRSYATRHAWRNSNRFTATDFSDYLFYPKGLGMEATIGRIAQEMRENADAAMFSSLLWTTTVFSAIFAVAMGYDRYIELESASSNTLWFGLA